MLDPTAGITAQLSVLATDEEQSESSISYTWSLVGSNPGPVSFSINGTNAAKNCTATFGKVGTYTFNVTATDSNGLSVTTSVVLTVNPILKSLNVTPNPASLFTNAKQQFTANATDQFSNAISNPTVTWTVSNGSGSITAAGLYTAPGSIGTASVTATSGSAIASASINILAQLAAPTNLSATNNGFTEVDLSWTAPSGNVTGYNIYRGINPGTESSAAINGSPISGTTYKDLTVSPANSYFYTVKAVNVGGASSASNEASATTATDLALNKTAVASSLQNSTFGAANALDGNDFTRWSSAFSDPQWIYVDLGSTYSIAEVKLNWENAAGANYLIQTSNDAINWNTVFTVAGNTLSGWHDYQNLAASGRYVRIYGTAPPPSTAIPCTISASTPPPSPPGLP